MGGEGVRGSLPRSTPQTFPCFRGAIFPLPCYDEINLLGKDGVAHGKK